MSMVSYGWDDGLDTLTEQGRIPGTRMKSAADAANRIQQLRRADEQGRAQRRALVKGLVDGNPPYRACDLRNAGRAFQCNVNWRVAEFYLNSARSAFYDVFSEAPTYATITVDAGPRSQEYSRIISEEFDALLRQDESWDYIHQISQYEMILYGCGPIIFCDGTDWRNDKVLHRDLLVPEYADSCTAEWEEAALIVEFAPHKLYEKIVNDKLAREVGWKTERVQEAIMKAHPRYQEGGAYGSWEWHQQQLKNQSLAYSAVCKSVSCAHYFYREFPQAGELTGRITHSIVLNPDAEQALNKDDYLFQRLGRFRSWDQIIHPMYYDNDGGGYHHSVTGLGVKMFSAMEYQNRLLCNLADKTFAPKVLFKPTTAQANEQLNVVQWGDYGKIPHNLEVQQMPVGSYIEDGIVFHREIHRLISSNLSQYNQSTRKSDGNPITATQAQIDASEQARLGKTQLNHYYRQADALYREKYRRASNPNLNSKLPGAMWALAFQQKCLDRGVPKAALRKFVNVIATRIIGQGSQFMRQQALEKLLGVAGLIQADAGRNNLLSDFIAAYAGERLVSRYNPSIDLAGNDQQAFATLQIAAAKNGVPPVVTPNQDHLAFAEAFIAASAQAAQSLEAVARTPAYPQMLMETLQFMDLLGPPAAQHLQMAGANKLLAGKVKALEQAWKKLAAMHDKLTRQAQQIQVQQQESRQLMAQANAIRNGGNGELELKRAETEAKIGMQERKTQSALRQKAEKHRQNLILQDAKTAADLRRQSQAEEGD